MIALKVLIISNHPMSSVDTTCFDILSSKSGRPSTRRAIGAFRKIKRREMERLITLHTGLKPDRDREAIIAATGTDDPVRLVKFARRMQKKEATKAKRRARATNLRHVDPVQLCPDGEAIVRDEEQTVATWDEERRVRKWIATRTADPYGAWVLDDDRPITLTPPSHWLKTKDVRDDAADADDADDSVADKFYGDRSKPADAYDY